MKFSFTSKDNAAQCTNSENYFCFHMHARSVYTCFLEFDCTNASFMIRTTMKVFVCISVCVVPLDFFFFFFNTKNLLVSFHIDSERITDEP